MPSVMPTLCLAASVVFLVCWLGEQPAYALVSQRPAMLLVPPLGEGAAFKGRVPTESHPIRGEARLAKMRREGRLPDTFTRGRCRYDSGDPEVAYYVKTCQ